MGKTVWLINQSSSTPDVGFAGRQFYLATEMAKRGIDVYLVAASFTHNLRVVERINQSFQIENVNGFHFVRIRVPMYSHAHSKKRILNWFLFMLKLRRLTKIIKVHPDVVLYSSAPLVPYLGAEYLARKMKAKLVFEVRDIWPMALCIPGGVSSKHPFIRFMQWVENRACKNADIVISNLKQADKHLIKHGMQQSKFHWIPNGFSFTEVGRPEPLSEELKQLLPKKDFLLGYTGTLGLANALENLLHAAAKLNQLVNIGIVIVGNGRDEDKLKRLSNALELDNVTFIPAIKKTQIQSMLCEFDALFVGARNDDVYRFGVSHNKLFDYLYGAKPIIYAVDSGDYHPIEDAGAGLEVPPDDPDALADAILNLYKMPASALRRMGENGRKYALEKHEYGKLAEDMLAVLFPKAIVDSRSRA